MLILTGVLLATALPAQHPPSAPQVWKQFQDAVARSDKEAVADMTRFPFSHPRLTVSKTGQLSRAEFIANYDRIFTPGMRRQIAKGHLHRVTQTDIKGAENDGEDVCGSLNDYVVEMPENAAINYQDDDESFLHPVFKQFNGKLQLKSVIGCE